MIGLDARSIQVDGVDTVDVADGDLQALRSRRSWCRHPIPTATGNQWAFALSDLGLSSAWMVGVAKSKPSDQVRIGLIGRDTALVATDPLLIRVAGNAGADASGKPLVDVSTVHAHAQGMPT